MIRRLRWKFTAVLMTIVTVMLLLILSGLYLSSKAGFERRSMEQLRSALRENPPHEAPQSGNLPAPDAADAPGVPDATGNVPGSSLQMPPIQPPGRQVFPKKDSVPTLVVDVYGDGTVRTVTNRFSDLGDEAISTLVSLVQSRPEPQGVIHESSLRYLSSTKDSGRIRYAFADISMEQNSLRAQLLHSLIIGILASVAFFIISALLSRFMVRPVEEAFNRQRQFVADASHELKTPLTVILSNVDMMTASPTVSDEKNKSRLERIQAETVRMKQLVENLLLLARSDSGRETAEQTPLNLSYIAGTSVMTFEPLIYDAGRTLNYEIEENLWVNGDSKKLRQLIDILLDNACKYSYPGTEITLRLQRTTYKEVLCSVRSEGAPLAKEELETIFERFYRSSESRGECQGYGLGLSIARTIAESHRGTIRAHSDGCGETTFLITLPCQAAPASDAHTG